MQQKQKTAVIIVSLCLAGVLGISLLLGALYYLFTEGKSFAAAGGEITEFYHDQGYVFMQPLEPTEDDDVTIRIRVLRGNLTKATLRFTMDVTKEKPASASDPGGAVYHEIPMHFEKKDRTGYYDYWTCVIPKQSAPYSYHFLLENNYEKLYVNGPNSYSNKPFTTTENDYYVMPGFTTPDWAKGALWYSIMPDSFYNGDVTNDKYSSSGTIQTPWGQNHSGGTDYLGGDLKGIMDKIDYLKELNVDAVFINPIWLSTHQAGYGALDLKQIDSAFGNEEDLKMLVDALHAEGIKVVLDGVFTYAHSNGNIFNGSDLFPSGGGANVGDEYYDMFLYDENGNLVTDWGMPMLDFSNPKVRDYVYAAPDSVMQYYLDKFDIDGWRLDVGNSLKGSDPNNWGTAEQIIKDMRKYVKKYGEDKLLMSEHGDGMLLKDYTLDSRWSHWPFAIPLVNYIAGKSAENVLMNDLTAGVIKIPRSIGNAQYNYTASHDLARTAYTAAGNESRLLAGNLLLMTYLGAPVIYYGDEVGMTGTPNLGIAPGEIEGAAPSSFGPMNWDESTWDYRIYNQQKALGQLREEYKGVYKDGAIVHLLADIKQNLIAFGRFNEYGRTITVTNAGDSVAENVRIEARRVEIKDGTVLVDYLSGKKYTVNNGFVSVDVQPGGCVLVEDEAGNARGDFWTEPINGGEGKITSDLGEFVLEGNSSIMGTRDTMCFAWQPARNSAEIVNTYKSGSYFIAARESLNPAAAYYGVAMRGGRGEIYVRKEKGGSPEAVASFTLSAGARWKIVRGSKNTFAVYVQSGTEWKLVKNSSVYVPMTEKMYFGVAALDGKGILSDLEVNRISQQYGENFENGAGNLFTALGSPEYISFADGKMKIQGSDGGSFAVSSAPVGDWSVQATFTSVPTQERDAFGLAALSDKNNYVSVRLYRYGGKIYLQSGVTVGGAFSATESVEYAGESVTLILEKYGMMYRVKYIDEDGNEHSFAKRINANYSDAKVALFAIGKGLAEIDDFRFGDGVCSNASQTEGYIDLSDDSASDSVICLIASDDSNWKQTLGGYENTTDGYSAMGLAFSANPADGNFSDFKLDVTLMPLEMMRNSGYIGIRFGASAYDMLDGYALRFTAKGELLLVREGMQTEVLRRVALPGFTVGEQHRVVVSMEGGNLKVYMGNSPLLKMDVSLPYRGGFVSYIAEGAIFRLLNRNEFALTGGWLHTMGTLDVKSIGEGADASNTLTLLPNAQGYAYAGMLDSGVTDFVFGGSVSMQMTSFMRRGRFGLLLGGSTGDTYKNGGILVGVESSGKIFIEDKNGELVSQTLQMDTSSFYFLVVVQGKNVRVFIDQYSEQGAPITTIPVLEYESETLRGSALNLYAEFANTELSNVYLYGLSEGEDYTLVKPYTHRPVAEPQLPEPNIGDGVMESAFYSFLNREDVAKFYKYGGGKWKYDATYGTNGMLSGVSYSGNWNMGATIASGKTADEFDLEFSMHLDDVTGLAGVNINKFASTSTHEESGIFIYTGNGFELVAYDGTAAGCARGTVTNNDGWIRIKISQRLVGGKHLVTVYDCLNNDAVVMSFNIEDSNRPSSLTGYVSLNIGNTASSFADIVYTKVSV